VGFPDALAIGDGTVTTSALRTIVLGPGQLTWPMAEPDDVLDYYADPTVELADVGDSLHSVSVSVSPSGAGELTVREVDVTNGLIAVWLESGLAGRFHIIRIVAETENDRTFEWLIDLRIDPKTARYPVSTPPVNDFSPPVIWPAGGAAVYGVSDYNKGSIYR
jgi:hypothetical protein